MADVALAYLHPAEVGHNFTRSLVETMVLDTATERRIGPYLAEHCSSSGHVAGRNTVARVFLDHTDADWLWWIDADMGFEPDSLYRLLATADPVERPVVGGLCFAWQEVAPDGLGGFQQVAKPTIYDWVDTDTGRRFKGVNDYPRSDVVRCAATGSAMIVIHRTALDAVRDAHGDHWYDRIPTSSGDGYMGEDISFCARLGAVGVPVHVDTSIRTNHLKNVYVGETLFEASLPRA